MIRLELISKALFQKIAEQTLHIDLDYNDIANTRAINILREIQEIVQNDSLSDFDALEEIINVFEKYGISAGVRHDF